MTRSFLPLAAPVSRRRLLEGAAALAATLIASACGANASPAATPVAGTMRPPGAASATGGSPTAAPTLPANATANALAPASSPGATSTAAPLAGSASTPLPAPGPALLQAFNKDADMKVLDAVDWEASTAGLQPFLTPTKSFFVRSHYPFPVVKGEDWKLTITGFVDKPVTLTYADLTKMPSRKMTAWIECAGDGRGRFKPMASGGQWAIGAVGNAEYTGVSLNDVLKMAAPKANVVDIVCSGAGNSQWARGLNWAKATDPDTMLFWQMNGEPLRVEQGFPVRLLVPGYPGVANVKWITNIDLIDHAYDGYFNTVLYTFINAEGKNLGQLTTMPVKSVITSLTPNVNVKAGMQTVAGKAWTGAGGGVTKVEVSTDGGTTWNEAKITQGAGQWSWYAFEYAWDAKDGTAMLTSRATDAKGNVQPQTPPFNKNGYQYNGWWSVPVTIGAAAAATASAAAAQAPAGMGTGMGAANAPTGMGGNSVNVTMKDFAITLDKSSVSPGSVAFTIVNVGPSPHNLAFPDLNKASGTIDAGATTKLTVDLKAGMYAYICNVPGHEQLGMKGTLTVK